MNKLALLPLFGALAACGAATPAPSHATASAVAAPNGSFAKYRTFTFGNAQAPRPGYDVTPRSLEVQNRLQGLVKSALEARGLTNVAEKADMTVKLSTGTGVAATAYRESGPPPALGFIGIDIFSAESGNQIWQGAAFAEIDPAKIDDALLGLGVDHMLQGFGSTPPASAVQGH